MEHKIRALLVQNRWNFIATLEKQLFAEGIACSIERTDFSQGIIAKIEKENPDVILINLTDSVAEAIDLCRSISVNIPQIPIIILAEEKDETAAFAAMKQGADDYVLVGQLRRLAAAILKAIKLRKLQMEARHAQFETKKIRGALRESRIAKRLLTENTRDLICEMLPDGTIIKINKPLGEGLGYSPIELLGKNPLHLVHPEDRALVITKLKEALNERKGNLLSFRFRHKNGEWRHLELSGDWIFDDEGKPVKAILVSRDVTEKIRAQEALEFSKKYAAEIINSSLDMIIAADINRNIIEFNPAAERTFGYKKEEILGKPADILYADPAVGLEINQILLTQGYCVREIINVRKNGDKFPSLLSASLLKDVSGKIVGMMGISRDISKEKKMQEELDRSRERLKQIIESVNIIPWESDFVNKRLLYIGKQAERILGYPVDLWHIPEFWENHIHPEDRKYVISYSLSAAEKLDNYESEYRMIAADGRTVWIHDVVHVVRENDRPVKLRGFMIDISARKEIEERLRKTNITLETLIDASPLGIVVFDMDGVVQVWNQAAEKILGWESYEILGKSVPIELAQEIPESFYRDPAATIDSLFHFKEKQLHKKDGTAVLTTLWCAPMFDKNQSKVIGMIFLISDITEHKQIVDQMQRLANFPRFNPYTVLELDSKGRITYFNDAAMQMAKSLDKSHPSEILPPETQGIVQHCLATGQSWLRMEARIGERTISWSFFPIVQNNIVHCYGSDITERLKLEMQLRQSQKMECVGQIAAGVAHDFNNILTVIEGHISMLLMMKEHFTPKQIDSLQQVAMAAERGSNLTRQLLTFSRRQVLQPKFIDLTELVSNISKMMKRLLGETINERIIFEEGLPLVWADPGMIEQVIMNLAINAKDAMPKGGDLIISLKQVNIDSNYVRRQPQAKVGNFICLSIKDTGIGMDESVMSHLFEPFFTTKEVGKGTGLGLATVYGIVKQHEGWIEVYSKPGQGSEFCVYLPAYTDVKQNEAVVQQTSRILTGNETILVVEDEDSVRDLICNILAQYGYNVLEAANGVEALEVWRKQKEKVNLLITDLIMPERVSGKELADITLAEKPDIKVIFISGYSPEIIGEDIDQTTNKFYLQKPFSLHTLVRFVRECLDTENKV
ncbi:MAG: PAS domain S-box protein [Verrucomicrobiia bacterium]